MTNSEAVEYAIKFLEQDYAPTEVLKKLKDIVSALEENAKLKAEIEQWQSTNLKLVCELTRLECENYQLKAQLERSVKLPCKVGDAVYRVNGKIIPMTIESVLIKNRNGNILIRIDCIENEFKGEFSYISDNIQNDIGKRVFLTREEAEQSLRRINEKL